MVSSLVTAVCPSPHAWTHRWPRVAPLRPSSSHDHRFSPWAFSCPCTLACQCLLPVPLVFLAVRREMDLAFSLFSALPSPRGSGLSCGFILNPDNPKCALLTRALFLVVRVGVHPASWHFLSWGLSHSLVLRLNS